MFDFVRNDPTEKEMLQFQLESLHRIAKKEDEKHRAEISAIVHYRWPKVQEWFLERRQAINGAP